MRPCMESAGCKPPPPEKNQRFDWKNYKEKKMGKLEGSGTKIEKRNQNFPTAATVATVADRWRLMPLD